MRKILVTGGCGFIGSAFIKQQFKLYQDLQIVNLDKLTYAGNIINLESVKDKNYIFITGDILDKKLVEGIIDEYKPDFVVNFAAETHVDRSIKDSSQFVMTNIVGTQVLMDACKSKVKKYVQISTDEVYGCLGPTGVFTEETPLAPNSPYSASKAAADMLVRSYYKSFNFPAIITRCSNNYGPHQYPEKLIPLFIKRLINNQKIPVYGTGNNIRDWIHVNDHCKGIDVVLNQGEIGQIYNFGGKTEKTVLEIAHLLLKYLDKSEKMIEYVEDRPGHDFRYAIDITKSKKHLGWEPDINFDVGLKDTVNWYVEENKKCQT